MEPRTSTSPGQDYQEAVAQCLQAAVIALTSNTPTHLRLIQVGLCTGHPSRLGGSGAARHRVQLGRIVNICRVCRRPVLQRLQGIHSHGAYYTAPLVGVLAMPLAINLVPGRPRSQLTNVNRPVS